MVEVGESLSGDGLKGFHKGGQRPVAQGLNAIQQVGQSLAGESGKYCLCHFLKSLVDVKTFIPCTHRSKRVAAYLYLLRIKDYHTSATTLIQSVWNQSPLTLMKGWPGSCPSLEKPKTILLSACLVKRENASESRGSAKSISDKAIAAVVVGLHPSLFPVHP